MSQFIEDDPKGVHAFIHWKGTDVCMDFYCECGAHHHIDEMFVYAVKCHACGAVWEMPCFVAPRRNDSFDGCIYETAPEDED